MRGKGFHCQLNRILDRITPAYAGKRYIKTRFAIFFRDHPRLCGEKCKICQSGQRMLGSPPPMRGKDENLCICIVLIRITPAYAGKSRRSFPTVPIYMDHPRLCGEKFQCGLHTRRHRGSPPPMRGKVPSVLGPVGMAGITPAYAGKRLLACFWNRQNRDHPRLCGEKVKSAERNIIMEGSPPPMRGKGNHGRS